MNALGILYYDRGKDELAERFLQETLTIREQALGPDHPDTMKSLSNLANLYANQRKDELVKTLFQQILSIQERVLGPEHPHRAISLHNLAALNSRQGKDELAEALYQQALTIREQALGPSHPETASSLENLAIHYSKLGKDELAEPLLQRALTIREEALGPDHPHTIGSQKNLADLRSKLNKDEPSDVECTEPGIIRDEELIAYLAGEAVRPMVELHLSRCPYCSSLLADYRQTEHLLTSRLYRWDCPPNQVLGEYQLNLLSHDEASDVEKHLRRCARCTAEVAQLAQFLADDPFLIGGTNARPSLIEQHHMPREARHLEDHLRDHWGTRRVVATLIPPLPRLAFQRQGAGPVWPRRYHAEGFSFSLQIEEDRSGRGGLQLIGFVTRKGSSLEALQGIPVVLSSPASAAYTQSIDELGNFVFSSISPATYTLELQLPESTIVIEQLPIEI